MQERHFFLVSGIFFDVHAGGGKSKIHTVSLHDIHDVQVQVVLHLQELGVDIGHQIGGDQNVDAGIPKVCEVIDINFRSTRIRSLDKTINVVTNSQICASTVKNAALRTMRPYKFNLGVTYNTTRPQLEQLMADLTAMLKASPYTYEDSVLVKLNGFGASSIDLLVSAYLRTADMTRFLQMQNDLNLDLMDVMQKNGVDFAFPSTTVYLEKSGKN